MKAQHNLHVIKSCAGKAREISGRGVQVQRGMSYASSFCRHLNTWILNGSFSSIMSNICGEVRKDFDEKAA